MFSPWIFSGFTASCDATGYGGPFAGGLSGKPSVIPSRAPPGVFHPPPPAGAAAWDHAAAGVTIGAGRDRPRYSAGSFSAIARPSPAANQAVDLTPCRHRDGGSFRRHRQAGRAASRWNNTLGLFPTIGPKGPTDPIQTQPAKRVAPKNRAFRPLHPTITG